MILRSPSTLMPSDDWCSEENNSNYLGPICALLLRGKDDIWETAKDFKSLKEAKWQENFQNYEKIFKSAMIKKVWQILR